MLSSILRVILLLLAGTKIHTMRRSHESKSNQPVTPMRYIDKYKDKLIQIVKIMVGPGVFSYGSLASCGRGIPSGFGG